MPRMPRRPYSKRPMLAAMSFVTARAITPKRSASTSELARSCASAAQYAIASPAKVQSSPARSGWPQALMTVDRRGPP